MARGVPILRRNWKINIRSPAEKRMVTNDQRVLTRLTRIKGKRAARPALDMTISANRVAIKLFLDEVKIPHLKQIGKKSLDNCIERINHILGPQNELIEKIKKIKTIQA